MTCLLSVVTPDALIQISDRRLTLPDGTMFDDNANKVILFDGRMAIAYAGLSQIVGVQTDLWLVRVLTNPPIRSLARAIYAIRDRATAAFRGWARRPSDKAHHRLVFSFIGWARLPDRPDLHVVVGFISNCHDRDGTLQPTARDDFSIYRETLEPGRFHGMLAPAVPLSTAEYDRLVERNQTAENLEDHVVNLVTAVREVALRDTSVSTNVLAVTIPRAVVEQTDGRRMIVLAGSPLTLDVIGSLYFPDKEAPIHYGPHTVYAGMGLTDFQGGPV